MRLEYQILVAVAADLLLGDPRWFPHPVRGIAWLAARLEGPTRRVLPARAAGLVTALLVYATAGGAAWLAVFGAGLLHPVAVDVVSIAIVWTTIAARDLVRHSMAVYRSLTTGDLPSARQRVAMIVGRDVDRLDESGVARAAVESVAESTVDGVIAPLFFAICLGPVGAMAYRAINTLDSTFGYTTERYVKFGWASARIDDVANWIPARMAAPLMCVAAAILRQRPVAAARIAIRDARHHASPNAGLPEAAMAGALGVQLGGANFYGGELVAKPTLGDATRDLAAADIRSANALMLATMLLFLLVGLAARVGAIVGWQHWRAA